MRSLTLRIFLSFWLIFGILIALAAIAGYSYSERLREAFENFEIDDTVLSASAVLEADGRDGLLRWIRDHPRGSPFEVYILDRQGNDLLARPLPHRLERMLRRFESRRRFGRHRPGDPPNLRPARPVPQLVGPDGAIYSLLVSPKRDPYREWISERAGPAFLLLALVISAAVSYALARAIARPVRKFREATVAIADGKLDTRIAASMRDRRDEIGMLAHDLDAMAGKLERAAEQQSELTRNISHELRSPLARLRVALELARRRLKLEGDVPEFARIDREIDRLDELIGQILSYSRMEAPTDGAPQSIDLPELIGEAVENANYECRSSGVEGVSVRLDCDADIVVDGYPSALTSAIENVLRNAIRHSPENGVVSVRAMRVREGVRIDIEDQGPGVPKDALENVFEPFVRAPGARSAESTGLGLSIARRAIERHGGSIRARNRDGGGLRVEIALPLRHAQRR